MEDDRSGGYGSYKEDFSLKKNKPLCTLYTTVISSVLMGLISLFDTSMVPIEEYTPTPIMIFALYLEPIKKLLM